MNKEDGLYSGKRIAKNTIFNLFGYGLPLLLAIIVFPILIKNLGVEKFGILNLAWIIIGYFSFFDLGIGRALTKMISEKIGGNKTNEIPSVFWTSFFLMLIFSIFITIVLLFSVPYLAQSVFKISTSLQEEATNTFYVLILTIPIVTTTAGIRGVLEAYQKFGIISVIRIILGTSSFLVPLVSLFFTKNLFLIVIFLAIIRVVIWLLYFTQIFKLNKNLKRIDFRTELLKPIIKFGGWLTLSNIIVPFFIYSDRFLIGALISAEAITYYATPYEVVSKLLIIPGAIAGVLFPAFSASYVSDPNFAKKMSIKAVKYILIVFIPIIFILLVFANEGLEIWLGTEFANKSSVILRILAVGIFFNSLAYIPYAFIEGIGRPDITAKVQLVELPIFLIAMWYMAIYNGISGVALVWMIRVVIDTSILFFILSKITSSKIKLNFNRNYLIVFSLLIMLVSPIFIGSISIKIVFSISVLLFYLFAIWNYFLLKDEKEYIRSMLNYFSKKQIKIQ